ncbi:unannotated protein [freshwater metagenome]|uniref:Unannotated protein n=1 Tax=freshwater metagenome TaxID=449393 RepID=A0A6J6HP79_9ZZZZ
MVAEEELFSLIIDDAVTDFPEPLSPTIPNVSPNARSKESLSTAITSPSAVANATLKFRTESTEVFDII